MVTLHVICICTVLYTFLVVSCEIIHCANDQCFSSFKDLLGYLGVNEGDLQVLKTQLENYQQVILEQPHVAFEVDNAQTVVTFLQCFDPQMTLAEGDRTMTTNQVHFLSNISETRKCRLGKYRCNLGD